MNGSAARCISHQLAVSILRITSQKSLFSSFPGNWPFVRDFRIPSFRDEAFPGKSEEGFLDFLLKFRLEVVDHTKFRCRESLRTM